MTVTEDPETAVGGVGPPPSLNNLNTSGTWTHTRTHSHPTPLTQDLLISHHNNHQGPCSSTQLTEALNLDFTNIPLPLPTSPTTSDVTKVLENFNSYLDQIGASEEDESPSKFLTPSASCSSSQKIKNSVEAFADLLLRGEGEEDDEDLLIVVDVSSPRDDKDEEDLEEDQEEDEEEGLDDLGPLEEQEDPEGYESDRPMVRASMRKLRPIKVKLKPVPEQENQNASPISTDTMITPSSSSSQDSVMCSVLVTTPTSLELSSNEPISSSSNLDNNVQLVQVEVSVPNNNNAEQSQSSSPVYNNNSTNEASNSTTTVLNPTTNTNTTSLSVPSTPELHPTSSTPSEPPPPPIRTTSRRQHPRSLRWPHRLSSVLALLGCTLGLNNVCRFGLLSVNYGANFVIQWVILSILFGIPLLTFNMSIGQYLSQGIIGMWKISPIFQGIGIGLLFSQAMIGLYSTVGVSWMLIYFRDSFIARGEQYRWGKCVREFRECDPYQSVNQTHDFQDTVPDYFHGVILQRSNPDYPSSIYVPNSLKFTVAFNLAVVWMVIFVSLSKGLKSYGKVIHGFILAPIAAMFLLTFKMVGMVDYTSKFGQTDWADFFFNTQTWIVAAREVFFTWGLMGACLMQVTSHNRISHPLKSDACIVVLVTTVILLLSAFVGNSCLSIITGTTPSTATSYFQRYAYTPSSFESDRTYKFLKILGHKPHGPEDVIMQTAASHWNHNSLLMGVRILKSDTKSHDPTVSGYQVLRLATELFPTTMAILSPDGLSPFWTVLFYLMLVLFGLAQQLAIWHSVIRGLIAFKYKVLKSWETTITFFVCAMGFALGLPLCTETGIFVTYFLDFAIGSGWWIMILYLLELVAVFIVRGAPYCGENVVTVLITGPGRLARFLAPLISFIWNVIMPVALLVLSIASFKSGNVRELYDWNPHRGYIFWPSWTREVGSLLQLLPVMAVPLAAIVQSCRYLGTGSSDLLERFQQLYRPATTRLGSSDSRRERSTSRSEDPPPKYTPPPSYSTATGAKIARFLRNSIRRSIRRINGNGPSTSSNPEQPPPPAYASVILEINAQTHCSSSSSAPPPQYSEVTAASARPKVLLSHTLSSDFGGNRKHERSASRRISSEINSRDIARMLSLRREETSVSVAPPYTSLEKMEQDNVEFLQHLEHLEPQPSSSSSTSTRPFDFLSFNRSRQRSSQDSQLALISDGYLYDNAQSSVSNSHVELDVDMRLGRSEDA